jgi:hypothetical protein
MKEPTKLVARRAREARLRSALRENLRRRKAQQRDRAPVPREGGPPGSDDAAPHEPAQKGAEDAEKAAEKGA